MIVREDLGEGLLPDFLQEEVFLVEKEDHGSLHEPLVVQDGVEEPQSLVHPVLRRGREGENRGEKRVKNGSVLRQLL